MRSVPLILVLCFSATAQTIPADYRAYLDAIDAQAANRHEDVVRGLEAVWKSKPESPLKGRAAVVAARSFLALNRAQDAIAIIQGNYDAAPQPEADLLLGQASAATGDNAAAAAWYQRVFYGFPLSNESAVAEAAFPGLQAALGDGFPPAMPQAVLDRAEKLRKAGQSSKAIAELTAAAPGFAGLERDVALVRARYGDYRELSALTVTTPEANAERLYLMHAAARRNSMETEAEAAMKQLDSEYPLSKWTMEALISWGNHFVLRNNPAEYEPLFRKVLERFPTDPQAAYCHWKLAWGAWMRREPGARKLLEEHVTRFPDSEKASAALYFLGRYNEVLARWPMSYYSVLARAKVKTVPVVRAVDAPSFVASAATRTRIARARQLERANLPEWAEFELRYAATEQPFVAAMELAEAAERRGVHDQALRYIKGVAKGYLSLPYDAAPERFWKLAFPMPYRKAVLDNSRKAGLDASLVSALIRQESEFNPKAISRARAYGLTQVLPSTGKQLSRRVGIRSFRPTMLFDPAVNLRLGTYYLQSLLASHSGQWEQTLAAFNAGKSRVDLWSGWYDYREPAEFIECIPFTETRNYVQIVLRNADLYRRLYGGTASARAAR
jgi:soluble lytic murein transglycosylase